MNDPVLKAYLLSFDEGLRIPYLERSTTVDGKTIIVTIYKNPSKDEYYCLPALVVDGEYLIAEVNKHAKYCTPEQVMGTDLTSDIITIITNEIFMRKRILKFLSNNPKLPTVINVAFTSTLIIYYTAKGRLRISRLKGMELIIDLPAPEQVYLKELLATFQIDVVRSLEAISYDRTINS